MIPYENLHPNSGVTAYEIGDEYIAVQFKSGDTYLYTYHKPGRQHVEQMKELAAQGRGLSTYISRVVRDDFESKL